MLNWIWFGMIIGSILLAGGIDLYNEAISSDQEVALEQERRNLNEETKLGQVTSAAIKAANTGVEIAIGLIGVMALWLGVMKIAEEAGLTKVLARMVRPITQWLFPKIPSDVLDSLQAYNTPNIRFRIHSLPHPVSSKVPSTPQYFSFVLKLFPRY